MDNADYLLLAAAASPFVVGLTEIVKRTGLPSKYAPLVSLLIGVAITALVAVSDLADDTEINTSDVGAIVLAGIVAGLMASGLYSGGRTTVEEVVQGQPQ